MRTPSVDGKSTRLWLFAIDRGLSKLTKKLKLPEHGSAVCWYLSGQTEGTAPYDVVRKECGLSVDQMAHVVKVLVKNRVLHRVRAGGVDSRTFRLRLSKKAETAFDNLLKKAAPPPGPIDV